MGLLNIAYFYLRHIYVIFSADNCLFLKDNAWERILYCRTYVYI